jgi:glycosyltransferase involved in cell wall biosynthesis
MRLHFSNVNFSSNTGPNSFGQRLADAMSVRGHQIVSEREDYDIFLCFIEPASMPRPGSRFVHRLDGIWFKPDQYETHNTRIKWAYNNSHHVIWQSEFDKIMTEKWWGPKTGSIVHNGINLEKVKIIPEVQEIRNKFNRVFSCSANWHRQKRLKENIDLFLSLAKDDDGLIVLGSNPDCLVRDPRVIYAGPQPHQICLQIYAISDWFLHLSWLDHCPNVVVEALSQGCPVICTDSGGTKEIVRSNGVILNERFPYDFQLCDYDDPPEIDIKNLILSKRPDVKNDHLDIERVCDEYERIFKNQ